MLDLTFILLLAKLFFCVLPGFVGLYWLYKFRSEPMMNWHDLRLKYPGLARRIGFKRFRGSLYFLCGFMILASPIYLWNGILGPILQDYQQRPTEFLPIVSEELIEVKAVERQFEGMTTDEIVSERTRLLLIER